MDANDIYGLRLHEFVATPYSSSTILMVIRVPGGWLYNTISTSKDGSSYSETPVASVFVPWDGEFL